MTKDAVAPEAEAETAPEEKFLTDILVEGFEAALTAEKDKAYGTWGFALFHSMSDEAAWRELDRLKIDPKDALAHYNRGCVQAIDGKFADAIKSFDAALKLDPEFEEAMYNRALALEKKGDAAAAKSAWTALLEICGDEEDRAEITEHLAAL